MRITGNNTSYTIRNCLVIRSEAVSLLKITHGYMKSRRNTLMRPGQSSTHGDDNEKNNVDNHIGFYCWEHAVVHRILKRYWI